MVYDCLWYVFFKNDCFRLYHQIYLYTRHCSYIYINLFHWTTLCSTFSLDTHNRMEIAEERLKQTLAQKNKLIADRKMVSVKLLLFFNDCFCCLYDQIYILVKSYIYSLFLSLEYFFIFSTFLLAINGFGVMFCLQTTYWPDAGLSFAVVCLWITLFCESLPFKYIYIYIYYSCQCQSYIYISLFFSWKLSSFFFFFFFVFFFFFFFDKTTKVVAWLSQH